MMAATISHNGTFNNLGTTRMSDNQQNGGAWNWWYLLLLAQFIPCLWVSYYNTATPTLIGMPFFYWFQLVLVLICAAVTAFVYFVTESSRPQ
jgi:hypothetical protein